MRIWFKLLKTQKYTNQSIIEKNPKNGIFTEEDDSATLLVTASTTPFIRTKAITAGVLSGVSDVVSQKLSGIQKIQLRRVLLKVIFAGGFLGPAGHFFHTYLDKVFKGKKDTKTVAKKVILEQLTLSPVNHLLFMIYYGVVIERTPWNLVRERIKKTYPTVQLTAWTFFPVVGWINYKYVPLHSRVILHSIVAFFWGIFLTLRARSMTTLALAKAK